MKKTQVWKDSQEYWSLMGVRENGHGWVLWNVDCGWATLVWTRF